MGSNPASPFVLLKFLRVTFIFSLRDFFCMDQREFNRQMDSYLKDRKEDGGFWKRMKQKIPSVSIIDEEKEQEQAPPDEVPVEQVQAVMRGESVARPEDEPEVSYTDSDDAFEEYDEVPTEGFFARLAKKLFGSYEKRELLHDEDDVDISPITDYAASKPEVDDDVKEMLRVCVKWVNRLPPEDIQAIKRQDEYRDFKRLLDKYNLIKK